VSAAATAEGTVPTMGLGRILWTGLGIVGALTVLAGGVSTLRRWDRPL
jgi:hypothetical protein